MYAQHGLVVGIASTLCFIAVTLTGPLEWKSDGPVLDAPAASAAAVAMGGPPEVCGICSSFHFNQHEFPYGDDECDPDLLGEYESCNECEPGSGSADKRCHDGVFNLTCDQQPAGHDACGEGGANLARAIEDALLPNTSPTATAAALNTILTSDARARLVEARGVIQLDGCKGEVLAQWLLPQHVLTLVSDA